MKILRFFNPVVASMALLLLMANPAFAVSAGEVRVVGEVTLLIGEVKIGRAHV